MEAQQLEQLELGQPEGQGQQEEGGLELQLEEGQELVLEQPVELEQLEEE